jgi:RNA polymerase-binding transcription factor DksA
MNTDEIRIRLVERLEKLDSRVHAINDDVCHKNNPLSSDWAEQAVERENEEVLEALGNASLSEIRQIKAAIARIDEGRYFDCVSCGEAIGEKRLSLILFADLCTSCAEESEKKAS